VKSLSNANDVQSTNKAAEEKQSRFVKIPNDKTPWILLGLDYADGFVHWVKVNGTPMRVVCGGGLEGQGFAPNVCPLCALTHEKYSEAKELEQTGNKSKAKIIRDWANEMRARMEVHVKVVRGTKILVKKDGGNKHWEADFDPSDDEDGNVMAGILPLSSFQWEGLTGLIEGENTEYITSGTDLGNRILWTKKESRKGKKSSYSAVVWDADEEEGLPDIEVDEELMKIDLTENFVIDPSALENTVNLLTGQATESISDDEEVELETDSSKEPDDSYLDDDSEEVDDLDDLDDDDDPEEAQEPEILEFEDDDPDEIPTSPKKQVKKSVTKSKPVTKKSTGNKVKIGGTKSGKARL
jgi:hypothetical protein